MLAATAGLSGCDSDSTGTADGFVEVSTETSGALVDGTGYSVTIDGVVVGTLGVSDAETFTAEAGERSIGLTDVESPCVVEGDNPQVIDLPAVTTISVDFIVTC